MISLGLFFLSIAVVAAIIAASLRLRFVKGGAFFILGIAFFTGFTLSFNYWVHFYFGSGLWPFYTYWSMLVASSISLAAGFGVWLRAILVARKKDSAA